MVPSGAKYSNFDQNTPNIGIIQITSQFGPFDNKCNIKIHSGESLMILLQNYSQNSGQ